MITKSTSSPRSIQDNALISTNKKINDFCEFDKGNAPAKETSLSTKLAEVKNTDVFLSKNQAIESPTPHFGTFASDFKRVGEGLPDNAVLKEKEHFHINVQHNIDHITDSLLPQYDVSYQSALTLFQNIGSHHNASYVEKIKELLIGTRAQKEQLQDHAMSLFLQSDLKNNNTVNFNDKVQMTADKQYSLFECIFKISYSFDDIERLLSASSSKDLFLKFSSEDKNKNKLDKLFSILTANSVKSLHEEMKI